MTPFFWTLYLAFFCGIAFLKWSRLVFLFLYVVRSHYKQGDIFDAMVEVGVAAAVGCHAFVQERQLGAPIFAILLAGVAQASLQCWIGHMPNGFLRHSSFRYTLN